MVPPAVGVLAAGAVLPAGAVVAELSLSSEPHAASTSAPAAASATSAVDLRRVRTFIRFLPLRAGSRPAPLSIRRHDRRIADHVTHLSAAPVVPRRGDAQTWRHQTALDH